MAKQDTASAFLHAIRQGEARKKPTTAKVTLEVEPEVLAFFEAAASGPQGGAVSDAMHRALRAHVDAAQAAPTPPERKGWRKR